MDHAPRAEEQTRLEKRMGEDVEKGRSVGPDPNPEDHIAQLADRRVGEHLLDIVLGQTDRRGQHRRQRANRSDDLERRRGQREQEVHPAHHVDAGGYHRRRMDEGADRRRPGHGVWQPHVQRNLSRLSGRANEQEQGGQGRGRHPEQRHTRIVEDSDMGFHIPKDRRTVAH